MHSLWKIVRRPFILAKCTQECKWEVYDATSAGCLRCGQNHTCQKHVFEGNCTLVDCDDGTRVCSITGYIVPEVRYSTNEYLDHVVFKNTVVVNNELSIEVSKYINKILNSSLATKCRIEENNYQSKKIYKSLIKCIRLFKLKHPNKLPNMCTLLTNVFQQEKRINFIYPASKELQQKCLANILQCILNLKSRGYKICMGNKLEHLVCGLIYLLKTGISYQNLELLSPIPEISKCLPMESRLKTHFDVNSKVITSVENEVKLAFRDFHQKH